MTRFFTLLVVCLLFALNSWAQLSIISPTNGATGVAISPNTTITFRSTSTGNTDQDPDFIIVEVSNNPDFDGSGSYASSDPYERIVDITEDIPETFTGLLPGTLYYARAYSFKFDFYSPVITFTTISANVTTQVRANFVNAGATSLTTGGISASSYANTFTVSMRLNQAAANATSYEWEFDSVSTAFANVSATLTSAVGDADNDALTVSFNCNASNFRSGKTYFVRVRGVNSTSNGPWSTSANIRRFVNSLHPTVLESPTGGLNRTAFKIWTRQVANATRYYFQVDDDPAFGSPHQLTGFNSYKNETVTGITGNVFRGLYTVGSNPGYQAFDYVAELTQGTTYYVRVRAWNANQAGYWHTVNNVTPSPTRTATITSPTNGATNRPTGLQFSFSDDPNYTETGYDFQLSTDNFASTVVNVSNQPSRGYFAGNLAFSTTYQARVRSYATGDASPSAWSTITFTTVAAPAITVTFPTNGLELNRTTVFFYAKWEGGIASWDWEVEKLNAPTSSTSNSTATYANEFGGYLSYGGSYRVRVRGVSAGAVTGAWSPWVNFTVATSPPARLGEEDEAVVMPSIAYPNPFSSSVTISNPSGALRDLIVLDAAGKTVLRTRVEGTSKTLGESLAPGIYQVILSGSDAVPAERLRIVRQ